VPTARVIQVHIVEQWSSTRRCEATRGGGGELAVPGRSRSVEALEEMVAT
jgi:hypothetical protein